MSDYKMKKGHIQEGKRIEFTADEIISTLEPIKLKQTIYLAHPFDRRFSKRKEMIAKKLEERDFLVIDPFVGEDTLCEKYGVKNYYENPCKDFAMDIKNRDFMHVALCDCFFAWIPKGVTIIGTMREFDFALEHSKYTIVLTYKPSPFLEDADELYIDYNAFLNDEQFIWM